MATVIPPGRGGRVVECVRLEIGCPKRTVGSNPTLSVPWFYNFFMPDDMGSFIVGVVLLLSLGWAAATEMGDR